ncbi:MAG: chloride channel protein [Geobacteraceae bacterium]|nr:chloride channel protein [Geobacteraceae bacterium]
MKKKIFEEVSLFASVVKWTAYASVVGALSGLATAGFLRSLDWASGLLVRYPQYYFSLPLVIAASSFLVKWLAPDAAGHGTEKVIEAVHKRMGKIPLRVVPVKLVATVMTLAFGGSAGKEGPCAQMGAGLASAFGDLLRLDDVDRRKLVICGISGGFATVFGTPVAGALFGIEVLVLGRMLYEVLFPSFVAGIVGYHVATLVGVSYPWHSIPVIPQLTGGSFLQMVLMGMFCGLIALFLIELMKFTSKAFKRLPCHYLLKSIIGGGFLVLIGSLVSPDYLGLGLGSIDAGLNGTTLPAGAFFWKSVATSITLGSGGSGGVVTPIFFIGTAAGNLFARIFHEPYLAAYSAIGMTALLAGAANTPIAASVMAIEMFGPGMAPHAPVACMVSFLIVGYRSVYPSQVLGTKKSASHKLETGMPVGEAGHAEVLTRNKSLIGVVARVIGIFHRKGEQD